jgi:hypothetical protein
MNFRVWLVGAATTLLLPGPTPAAQIVRISVGQNVSVSKRNPALEHTEFLVAQDPKDPRRLLACTMIWSAERNRLSTGIYTSFDRGITWRLTYNDTSERTVWDPACAYTNQGTALFATLPVSAEDRARDALVIYRSTDGGKKWSAPLRLPFEDRQYFTVDRTGSEFDGRIYLHSNGGVEDATGNSLRREVHLYYSTDDGKTFSGPVPFAEPDSFTYKLTIPGQGTVLKDGTLLLPYWTRREPKDKKAGPAQSYLEVFPVTQGGESIDKGIVVGKLNSCNDITLPTIDVDRSGGPFNGRAYLAWGEKRAGRCRILLAYSTDGGKQWSQPILVDDTPSPEDTTKGPDAFLPAMAVNSRGVVGLMWYDRREDAANNRSHRLRFAASTDGGETVVRSVPVSSSAFRYSSPEVIPIHPLVSGGARRRARGKPTSSVTTKVIYAPRLYDGVGDTNGMTVATDGTFNLFWIDNRTGVSHLYMAPVKVDGEVALNGAAALAPLGNVSNKVEVDYSRAVYNGAAHTIVLDVTILNSSKDTLQGPLRLRAITLTSDHGTPVAANSDNGEEGPGAVWSLASSMPPSGKLLPGESTKPRRLVFRVLQPVPLKGRSSAKVIEFETKVLAPPYKSTGQ